MRDEKQLIATGIAQQAQHSPEFKRLADKGLIDFLRDQIVDAEWKIARAKAEIEAYQTAIVAIEKRHSGARLSEAGKTEQEAAQAAGG